MVLIPSLLVNKSGSVVFGVLQQSPFDNLHGSPRDYHSGDVQPWPGTATANQNGRIARPWYAGPFLEKGEDLFIQGATKGHTAVTDSEPPAHLWHYIFGI